MTPEVRDSSWRLTVEQQAEIDASRAESRETRRVTVAALEEVLFQPLPVLDHGFVDCVISRPELPSTLARLISLLGTSEAGVAAPLQAG